MAAADDPGRQDRTPIASIVIPAHNEAAVIGRLLTGLLADAEPDEFEILVICNGCTDRTAQIATDISPDVIVLQIETPSKSQALVAGDDSASHLPRIYLDADLEISAGSIRALVAALTEPGVQASGPRRVLPTTGVSWPVRAYYRIWEQLPQVRTGLFGRGVIALSGSGLDRVHALPPSMSDDLAISEAFQPHERRVLDSASVIIRPPRTIGDLLRRRIRVNTGNAQLDQRGGRSSETKTSTGDLITLARQDRANLPGVAIFLAVAAVSRLAAKRRTRPGEDHRWLRDESSRRPD